jgi:hypothetical protein
MPWMLLTPREADEVMRARATPGSPSQRILTVLQHNLDQITGDLDITPDELDQVRQLAGCWQCGGTKGLKAVLAAADRHGLGRTG